jgi:hypothetical protein
VFGEYRLYPIGGSLGHCLATPGEPVVVIIAVKELGMETFLEVPKGVFRIEELTVRAHFINQVHGQRLFTHFYATQAVL